MCAGVGRVRVLCTALLGACDTLGDVAVYGCEAVAFNDCLVFFFQAEDGIRDLVRSRGLGDVYKRQRLPWLRARPLRSPPL